MAFTHHLLLALLLVAPHLTEIGKLEAEKHEIELKFFKTGKGAEETNKEYLEALFGTKSGDKSDGVNLPFILDTNSDQIAIADGTNGFGQKCDPTIGCELLTTKKPITYKKFTTEGTEARALLRFAKEQIDDKKQYTPLNFLSFDGNAPGWEFEKKNLLGLGLKSPLWGYLHKTLEPVPNQEYREISLSYFSKNVDKQFYPEESDFSGSRLIVNDHAGVNEPVMEEVKTSSNWLFENAYFKFWKGAEEKKLKVCVSSSENFQIALKPELYQEVIKHMNKDLCGEEKDCIKEKSTLDRIDPVKIKFQVNDNTPAKIELRPVDFLYYEQKTEGQEEGQQKAAYAIRQLDASVCDNWTQADVAVGRLFLTKAEIVIRIMNDGKLQLGFNETVENNDKIFLIILIILGCLILAILVAILILKICKRRAQEDKSGDYRREEDEP